MIGSSASNGSAATNEAALADDGAVSNAGVSAVGSLPPSGDPAQLQRSGLIPAAPPAPRFDGPSRLDAPVLPSQDPPNPSVLPHASVLPQAVRPPAPTFEERVKAANTAFQKRVGDAMSLPLQVVLEQRDAAFRDLAEHEARMQVELDRVAQEHERFVNFLMEEQLANLRHVRDQLDATKEELQRARALAVTTIAVPRPRTQGEPARGPGDAVPTDAVLAGDAVPTEQLEALRNELELAFAEVDETRQEAARLQEERDEAIRANDEVRLELQGEIERARDETFEVQQRLDEALRELNDARDEARDEAMRLTEELDELRRERDERTEEVRKLREKLDELEIEVKHSNPPPAEAGSELDAARREVKWLRQQLIEAKRKMSNKGTGRLEGIGSNKGTASKGIGHNKEPHGAAVDARPKPAR